MTKPSNFIQNSDYASLKNDAKNTFTLYLGASPALTYGTTYTYESFLDIGTSNSPIRCQIRSDVASSTIYSSPQMKITLQAVVSGDPTPFDYPTTVYIERISATRIRLICNVWGYVPGRTVTITGKFQTITADVVTFLSPFN